MVWGKVEVRDEEDKITEAHILPFGPNKTGETSMLWWHTTSELCGCNPRPHTGLSDYPTVTVYEHFEDAPLSQEAVSESDGS